MVADHQGCGDGTFTVGGWGLTHRRPGLPRCARPTSLRNRRFPPIVWRAAKLFAVAIQLRPAIAVHIAAHGWAVVDIGQTTPESTHYPIGQPLSSRGDRQGYLRLVFEPAQIA